MSSYFFLKLDIESPTIEIFSPSYTTPSTTDEIIVTANEELSTYQEIYIVDSGGNRHDFTFSHEGDKLVGLVSYSNFTYGAATIYARVKDIVGNLSNIATKTIHVIESEILTIEIDCIYNDIDLGCINNNIELEDQSNEIQLDWSDINE